MQYYLGKVQSLKKKAMVKRPGSSMARQTNQLLTSNDYHKSSLIPDSNCQGGGQQRIHSTNNRTRDSKSCHDGSCPLTQQIIGDFPAGGSASSLDEQLGPPGNFQFY
jgi:hypothetical protein